jgi:hypothetical protein
MLADDVKKCLAIINYLSNNENTIEGAINRILGEYIYDTIGRVSAKEILSSLRSALGSNEKLSVVGYPITAGWSEEKFRELLSKLADRIESYESSGVPRWQDLSELIERIEKFRPLVQPLAETITLSDAIKRFEENVLPALDYMKRMDAVTLIRFSLWFDTSKILPLLFTREVTDTIFREYLLNIAWKIEDARKVSGA